PRHDADAPFSLAKPGSAPRPIEPLEGAPWAGPATPAPRPAVDFERTLYIPPAEPAPGPEPEPEVIEVEEDPPAAASPGAAQPASAAVASDAAPLPRTRHVPLPDLNEALYAAFPSGRR